jgi:hypothetical protein
MLAIACSGCHADPTTRPATVPADPTLDAQTYFLHQPSGIAFPRSLHGYVFAGQKQYNREATDVSFSWSTLDGNRPMAATVYVLPAPSLISIGSPQEVIDQAKARLFDQFWEQHVRSIVGSHAPATTSPPETVTLVYAGHAYTGRRQLFHYEQVFAFSRQQVTSSLYLFPFVNEKWSLKYRFTYPASVDMQTAVDQFIMLAPANAPSRNTKP